MLCDPLRRVGFVCLSVAMAGCLSPSEPEEAPACKPATISTADWQTVSQTPITFRVPQDYVQADGTRRWESGRTWVEAYFLQPSDVSNEPPITFQSYTDCRAVVRGRTLIIQLGFTSPSGRYGTGYFMAANWGSVQVPAAGGIPERRTVVVQAFTPVETLVEELLAVVWSVLVTGSGIPLRDDGSG
ncbi:MAG: hypothetical protein L0271_03525 [Gemmatimonadetes bacterium]|nr:hypothetical protein [Gemmatimonadota bacterium]